MAVQQIADIEGLKARAKATWMAGDFARIAEITESTANDFIARRALKPTMRVLDVACGTGNLSVPAAKAGGVVTGVDIAPNPFAYRSGARRHRIRGGRRRAPAVSHRRFRPCCEHVRRDVRTPP